MSEKSKFEYSIIVPVFNEADNVASLHGEVVDKMEKLGQQYEILFVDDGSADGTFEALQKLRPIKIVRLRTNSGQSSALDAGIKEAKGDMIITLDGDGQNDPADIPKLLDKLGKGFDVVCGWRYARRDPFLKRFISQGAAFLRRFLVDDGVHDAGCTLRVYRKECFEDLDLYGEFHRMIPALLKWRGFRISEVKVNHRPRLHGSTKYSWRRIMHGLLDMIYVWFWRKYSTRPLHLFGGLGLFFIFVGSMITLLMAYLKIFYAYTLSDKIWPLVGFVSIVIGIQLLVSGLLAANIVETGSTKRYYIEEIVENS